MFAFIKNAIKTHKALVQIKKEKKNPLYNVNNKLITMLHIQNSKLPSYTNCHSDSKSASLSYTSPFDPNM